MAWILARPWRDPVNPAIWASSNCRRSPGPALGPRPVDDAGASALRISSLALMRVVWAACSGAAFWPVANRRFPAAAGFRRLQSACGALLRRLTRRRAGEPARIATRGFPWGDWTWSAHASIFGRPKIISRQKGGEPAAAHPWPSCRFGVNFLLHRVARCIVQSCVVTHS